MEEEAKQVRHKKKKRNSVLRIAGMSALILLLILAVGFVISDVFGKNTADGLFCSVSSDNVSDMVPYSNGGLALLTDTSVKYFDAYGNSIAANEITYANPVIKTSGKNVLLYDRGGYSLRIEKNAGEFSSQTFESVITAGAIGKKGNYAYVLNSNGGYQSHLYVYNFRGSKQFEWGCSSDYITDVELSENGKNVCAAVMGADNAEYYSEIILFGFNSDKPLYRVRFADTAVYDIVFAASKKVVAFSDKGVFLVESDGEYTTLLSYSPTEMKKSSSDNKDIGSTVINRYGNENNVLLTVFAKGYKEIYQKEYFESVKQLYSSNDYTAVAFDKKIEIINSENSLTGQIELSDGCLDCVVSGKNVFVLVPGGVMKYNVNSNG